MALDSFCDFLGIFVIAQWLGNTKTFYFFH